MESQFSRMELLLGQESITILQNARVAVFGIGGVGGYVVEALARCGVGSFDLIDNDKVALSNLNRQIIATHSSIGQYKVDIMKKRILDINPEANVSLHRCFFLPEQSEQFDFTKYSYIVDAIDTVTAKIELVMQAKQAGVPIISAMGAGNKLDPTCFEITDIYKTKICPLARVMRRELKKRNIDQLKVVYSTEEAKKPQSNDDMSRRVVPGSVAFVPSVAGLIVASEVVKDLCNQSKERNLEQSAE
ncbi:MAG: tRNA threonylcarbamoyladenosine dehydratase [Clostridiales bacterium]|nr:tRNA threonylcarbamoyladenosine dehydratase [Clostridiales bacterium]